MRKKEVIFGAIILVAFIGFTVRMFYLESNRAGYYCIYCGEGSTRGKSDAKVTIGDKPCNASPDSMHVIEFMSVAPKFTREYKYVKEIQ